jgi:predicted transcriptional regulator
MKVLIEIEDDDGELLDALAKEQDRSRSAQARHMLTRAVKEAAASDPKEDAEK